VKGRKKRERALIPRPNAILDPCGAASKGKRRGERGGGQEGRKEKGRKKFIYLHFSIYTEFL